MCEDELASRPTADLLVGQARRLGLTIDPARVEREQISAELRRKAADAGLFGLTIPEEHGGAGLSLGAACRIVEELAVHDRALATCVGLHNGLGTRGIVELAKPEVRDELLPALAAGDMIASFAATEPGAGSDLAAVRTTGLPEGDELRVSGAKSYVTNGGFAGVFTVLARTPGLGGDRATSLLLIPRDLPGVEIGPEEDKLGIRGSSTVTVHFSDVRLPLTHVLGEPGQGLALASRILCWGRTLMSAGCVGTARAALDTSLAYVQERKQFGKVIGEQGAVRAHLGAMSARLWAMRSMVEHVGCLMTCDKPIDRASSAAKVFCSEGAFDICDRAVQLHGAMGYLEPTGVARMLRDCRVTRIFEGANDVLLVHLGLSLLGGDKDLATETGRPCEDPCARRTAPGVETVEAKLRSTLAWARKRYGLKAVAHQLVLIRLARAYVLLAAARSCTARPGLRKSEWTLAAAACRRLLAEATDHIDAVFRAEDDEGRDRALTDELYGKGNHLPVWPCEGAP